MMTFMTVLLNDVLINIESDNRADCTQRFHLKEHSCRWLNLITSQWISQSVRFSSQLCRDLRTCEYMLRVLSAALQVFVLVFNTHLPFYLWCFITISSLNMSRKAAEPVYSLKMPNVEKSLDVQPPTADNMLSKVELKKPLLNNADSSEVAENKSKKKKKEGIKNYFISDESKYLCWIELIHQQWIFQYANRLNILVHHHTYRRSCGWCCFTFDDIGVQLINSFLQQFCSWSGQHTAVHCSDQLSCSLLCVFVCCLLHHQLHHNTLHMYYSYQNHTLLEKDVSEEFTEAESMAFQ